MTAHGATGICWDLSDLYQRIDDPQIDSDLTALATRATDFEARYRGQLADGSMTAATLAEALGELESISEGIGKLYAFADLTFSGDTRVAEAGALVTRIREAATDIRAHLLFLELEWSALDEAIAGPLQEAPELAHYRHYLACERDFRPYRKTEGEELILDRMGNTGRQAFTRLFDEILARMRVTVNLPGGAKEMAEEEALALLSAPDREVRKAAADAMTAGLSQHGHLLTYIFNTVVADHAAEGQIRNFPDPMTGRNLSNEISPESVQALLNACSNANPLVHDYYGIKKSLLGLEQLTDYDRYAPLSEPPPVPFEVAKQMVLDSYGAFSPQMADIAQMFFDRRWIDADPREGKRGGAFAHPVTPSTHPYVLVNYLGRPRDVMTLAHELGHGVHQWLARDKGYFGADTPLTTAETASVFGEMLVFSELKRRQPDDQATLALLCSKLEDTFSTVFRQVAMTRFEMALHATRSAEGELSAERIDGLWMEANRPMFGDSLTLRDDYASWWRYIPHFVHTPFYCYAYAYGELLVLSLYRRYQEEGEAFVPRYLELLSAGGSDRPEVLLAKLGVDITRADFWEGGLAVIREWVSEAQCLAKSVGKTD